MRPRCGRLKIHYCLINTEFQFCQMKWIIEIKWSFNNIIFNITEVEVQHNYNDQWGRFLKINLVIFVSLWDLSAYITVYHICTVSIEARRGISWTWHYRGLQVTLWELKTESQPFKEQQVRDTETSPQPQDTNFDKLV